MKSTRSKHAEHRPRRKIARVFSPPSAEAAGSADRREKQAPHNNTEIVAICQLGRPQKGPGPRNSAAFLSIFGSRCVENTEGEKTIRTCNVRPSRPVRTPLYGAETAPSI
jgi:hypothetical protein